MAISGAGDRELISGNQTDPESVKKQLDDSDEIRLVSESLR